MKKYVYAALLAVVLCFPYRVYAAFSDSISVENTIFTGDVQIGIKEYEIRNGKEILYSNPKEILPGDQISKIVRIQNHAKPCWIRASIRFQSNLLKLDGLDESMLLNIGKNWEKIGMYYYYTKTLDNKKSTDLFTGIAIPAAWTEAHSEQKLQMEIRVDAIQAANFQPDFQAMSPWGNEAIEQCVHETDGRVTCKREKIPLSIQFNGIAHKLLAVPDDFFSNFPQAMPGDLLMDDVEVSNTTEKEAEIFFQTKMKEQSLEQEKLLQKLKLTITLSGVVIYEGDLRAAALNDGISLGKFLPGQKERLSFSIVVPKELNNGYALQNADVIWSFTVKEDEKNTSGGNTQTAGLNPNTNEMNPNTYEMEEQTDKASSVTTGDNSPVEALMIYLLLGAAVFPVSLKLRKGGKHEK